MFKLFGKWIALAVAALAVAFSGAMLWGWMLPAHLEAKRSVVINRPPETVWWVLTDYNNAALWHPQYKTSRAISAPGEKPIRWRVLYTDGKVANIEVREEKYARHLVEGIADAKLPFTGSWTVDLEPDDEMCKVTVHSSVVIRRPLDRLFVHWLVDPQVELAKILNALRLRVETSTVRPTPGTS